MLVNSRKGGRAGRTVAAWECPDSFEAGLLPPPEGSNPTKDFLDALYTLTYTIVMLPAYLVLSVALALAFYIRCAGVLLTVK